MCLRCSDWDRDLPSLPCKSHKTINLTSMNHHPTFIGSPNTATVNSTSSLAFTSQGSIETTKEIGIQQIIVSFTRRPHGVDSVLVFLVSFLLTNTQIRYCIITKLQICCETVGKGIDIGHSFILLQDVASIGMNGGSRDKTVTMKNKGKEHRAEILTRVFMTSLY